METLNKKVREKLQKKTVIYNKLNKKSEKKNFLDS